MSAPGTAAAPPAGAGPEAAVVGVGGDATRVTGAQAAIVRDGRVLVQLRPWPPGWELPGGHLGADETAAACAAREAREETGLHVRVVRLVGVYRWTGLRTVADAVYLAEPTGGRLRRCLEAVAFRWVAADELPATLFPWLGVRITDALAGDGEPVLREQPVGPRHVLFFGMRWLALVVDGLRRRRRPRGRC